MQAKPRDRQEALYQIRLDRICDATHPLCKLSRMIQWSEFDDAMAESFEERGDGEVAGRNDQDGFADEGIEANQLESGACGDNGAGEGGDLSNGRETVLPDVDEIGECGQVGRVGASTKLHEVG